MRSLIELDLTTRNRTRRAESPRRITLNAGFDQALVRLAAARREYDDLASHGGSLAARLDALDHLNDMRTEMAGLRIGAGLEL
jgi:hypothetical protein